MGAGLRGCRRLIESGGVDAAQGGISRPNQRLGSRRYQRDKTSGVGVPADVDGRSPVKLREEIARPKIRYRRERWLTPDGQAALAPLSPGASAAISGRSGAASCWRTIIGTRPVRPLSVRPLSGR